MRNHWIRRRIRKRTRLLIRAELDNPIDMDDDQLDLCIEVASKYFYKYRSGREWQLALEGAILLANVMLQRIRRLFSDHELLEKAEEAYRDWEFRVAHT